MVEAKISITTKCNAHCRTCPVWKIPGETMPVETFRIVWEKLMDNPMVSKVMINDTGDVYCLPNHAEYFEVVKRREGKTIAITTNAIALDMVPDVDHFVISFNGGTRKAYEHTVGASFDAVVANIRAQYDAIRKVPMPELHCLIWQGNQGTEMDLMRLWKDFPGRLRVSYKYDNQGGPDLTVSDFKRSKREPCDYLGKLCIMPDGKVISCAHDFHADTDFGNIVTDSIEALMGASARVEMLNAHMRGEFTGICERCNYNTPIDGRVMYLK